MGPNFAWDKEVVRNDRRAVHRDVVRSAQRREDPVADVAAGAVCARCCPGWPRATTIDAITVGVDTAGSFQYHIG